jgi:hypothetical protein
MTTRKRLSLLCFFLGFAAPVVYVSLLSAGIDVVPDSNNFIWLFVFFFIAPSVIFWSASILLWAEKRLYWIMWVIIALGAMTLLSIYGMLNWFIANVPS